MTAQLAEIHRNRELLKSMIAPDDARYHSTPAAAMAAKCRVLQFRRENGLGPHQLLINGSGDIATLIDVASGFMRLALYETGQVIHVPVDHFQRS